MGGSLSAPEGKDMETFISLMSVQEVEAAARADEARAASAPPSEPHVGFSRACDALGCRIVSAWAAGEAVPLPAVFSCARCGEAR